MPGCMEGFCTSVKEDGSAAAGTFMGGCELRGDTGGGAQKLKSIDDFNKGKEAVEEMSKIKELFKSPYVDVDDVLFDQMIDLLKKKIVLSGDQNEETEVLMAVGKELKNMVKSVVREGMRL